MATLIGTPKRTVSLNTENRRQASLSECLTEATLTQARLKLASAQLFLLILFNLKIL